MERSNGYIIGFAIAVCMVCSILVSGAAVALKDKQDANVVLDRQIKVLTVAGLVKEGEAVEPAKVDQLFKDSIRPKVIVLKTGAPAEGVDAATFDQLKASKDPATSTQAPANMAKVPRVPNNAMVYHVVEGGAVTKVILPIEGKGLWSTLYGFMALDAKDLNTVRGLTFYKHAETPGLGGEVDNPKWKGLWNGRKAFDAKGEPALKVIKGVAGSPEEAPHSVDGLSGATLTCNGVTHLVQFWLGDNGFGPYLAKAKKEGVK